MAMIIMDENESTPHIVSTVILWINCVRTVLDKGAKRRKRRKRRRRSNIKTK
ncbi:hypothetical protein RDWZM_005366, partial [Blomia tropicalis]